MLRFQPDFLSLTEQSFCGVLVTRRLVEGLDRKFSTGHELIHAPLGEWVLGRFSVVGVPRRFEPDQQLIQRKLCRRVLGIVVHKGCQWKGSRPASCVCHYQAKVLFHPLVGPFGESVHLWVVRRRQVPVYPQFFCQGFPKV